MDKMFNNPIKIYGVKLKNKQKRMQSQSGGAFTALAEYFLNNKAVVYGCGMNANHIVEYKRITDIDHLDEIKGSKYVQADLGDTFKSIIKDLENGFIVLYAGTPCSVAGIKNITANNKNKNKLITVDFICHGVPSPSIYSSYIDELERKMNSKVAKFVFRDKYSGGWHKHIEKVIYENDVVEIRDEYTKVFYTNLSLRPSCGKCRFSTTNRVSDFTVGDFWGVQNLYPEIDDNTGVSTFFCNTSKALSVFKIICEDFEYFETDINYVMQPNLKGPSKIPKYRKQFWKDYRRRGVLYCAEKWPPIIEFPNRVKNNIKKIIKSLIRYKKSSK